MRLEIPKWGVSLDVGFMDVIGVMTIVSPLVLLRRSKFKGVSMNQDFNEIVDVVEEGAKAYKKSMENGKFDLADFADVLPPLLKLPAAIKGSPEAFKGLKIDDVKDAVIRVLEASGEFNGKVKLYVESGVDIIGHGVGIYNAIKAVKEGHAEVAEVAAKV